MSAVLNVGQSSEVGRRVSPRAQANLFLVLEDNDTLVPADTESRSDNFSVQSTEKNLAAYARYKMSTKW